MELTNRMWFSVVCTLIDNDTGHHSGQTVVDSGGAATISTSKKMFLSERELKKALRDTLTRAVLSRPLSTTANKPIRLEISSN